MGAETLRPERESATRTSAFERLRSLSPLLRGSELTIRFNWDSHRASQAIHVWKNRGLLAALGGHTDVYANLVVNPSPNWEAALLMARPSAVIVGIDCLRRAGWTTQIPSKPEVAIDRHVGVPFKSDHFVVGSRSDGWFEKVRAGKGLVKQAAERASLRHDRTAPALRPAWALAELLARANNDKPSVWPWGNCGLQPDDIDWDLAGAADREDWARASSAFALDLEVPELEESDETSFRERDR